ncbi:solute carrier family 13 member 5-like [Ixodes scapularis]|uniref:solute carrier family 13 member 5-like n=1 Tax=Ixodes scapularis TaxID=6945 RepID=UPI001C3924A3|nr:solute carrier family 13 member 5-like [Ixodes scapularis]
MVPLVDATVHEIHYTYMRSLYVRKFGPGKPKPSVTCEIHGGRHFDRIRGCRGIFAVPMTGTDIEKRILSWSVVCNKMSWGMLLTFGGGLALADASEATKLSDDFVTFVQGLNIVNPVVMQVLLSLSASFLTEFTPNDAAASMLLPVVITVACGLRINPLYLAVPVSLAVTQSCILPASSSVITIIADEGHITTKDLLVPGIMVKLVCQIVNLVFINTSGQQVFRLSKFPSWAQNCSTAYTGKTVQ